MAERWRPIVHKGIPFPYEVSDQGRIRNARTRRIKRQQENCRTGYRYVMLSGPGKLYPLRIASLVVTAFLREREPWEQIDHINGSKTDDRLKNLEIVTQQINVRRRYNMQGSVKRTTNHFLTPETHERIKEIWQTGEYSQVDIARMFGITNGAVSKIIKRKSKVRSYKNGKQEDRKPDFSKAKKTKVRAKLNASMAREIYESTDSQKELAQRFGVSQVTVSKIKSGSAWRAATGHVSPSSEEPSRGTQ
ncbi:NUMOD4 domain-containing protein [Rhodopirellula halodulae]|uniref:NUMOD4 domain-containing protein n=1 Tax=Rhodopirellula halodulae TaxID=2894198 RepID=UPI001E4AA37E|nr:NUMOD4 domain-containing protein [Rhodopirellula sp. JC737]MCC9655274.1 HNH endonuclease [Rhodopirellula sp. JC737]